MCPVCGTLLELAESPQAQREKAFVSRLVAEGKSKDEIKDALVAEYGTEVLALPQGSGFDLSAYLVPIVAFVIAVIALAIGVLRWRRAGAAHDREEPAAGERPQRRGQRAARRRPRPLRPLATQRGRRRWRRGRLTGSRRSWRLQQPAGLTRQALAWRRRREPRRPAPRCSSGSPGSTASGGPTRTMQVVGGAQLGQRVAEALELEQGRRVGGGAAGDDADQGLG